MRDASLGQALTEVEAIAPDDAPIPKLIHMTAGSKQQTGAIAANLDHIRSLNPQWTLTLYDDQDIERFIARHYGPGVQALYGRLNPRYGAARADLFRYLLLYACGGVYLDLKSATTQPLDSWLRADDRYVLSQWDNQAGGCYPDFGIHPELSHIAGGEYQQWFIIAAKGHPFLKAVIQRVLGNIAGYGPWPLWIGRHGTFRLTGPVPYTLAIHPLLGRHAHRLHRVEPDGGLRYSIFSGERDHHQIFKAHYSQLTEPIVRLEGARLQAFKLVRALKLRSEALRLSTRLLLSRCKRLLLGRKPA
jgi:hypothetical protein